MSKRILELAERATKHYPATESSGEFSTFDKAMFAELIVRECASMARVYHSHEYDFTGDLELDEFMLKHFGVRE